MTAPRENPQPPTPVIELPPEEMAITPYDGGQSLVMSDQEWADEIVARVTRQEKIVEAFVSTLDPETDLCIVHGTPSFSKGAMMKLLNLAGGTFEFLRDNKGRPMLTREDLEDDRGKFFVFTGWGKYTTPTRRSLEMSASFSSREPFFGRKKDWKTKETHDIPVEEINADHVRAACQNAVLKKCLFTALGFGSFTLERLSKLGIDTDKIPGYRGKDSGNGDGYQKRPTPRPKAAAVPAPETSPWIDLDKTPGSLTTDQAADIEALAENAAFEDEDAWLEYLGNKHFIPVGTGYDQLSEANAAMLIAHWGAYVKDFEKTQNQ